MGIARRAFDGNGVFFGLVAETGWTTRWDEYALKAAHPAVPWRKDGKGKDSLVNNDIMPYEDRPIKIVL